MSHASPSSQRHVPLWLLVMVTLAGTLAMHMFIPALPVKVNGLVRSRRM